MRIGQIFKVGFPGRGTSIQRRDCTWTGVDVYLYGNVVRLALLFLFTTYSGLTIRVKWPPKPDPVKRRPPATRRFYLTELACRPRARLHRRL
jgi:hypothetical protein